MLLGAVFDDLACGVGVADGGVFVDAECRASEFLAQGLVGPEIKGFCVEAAVPRGRPAGPDPVYLQLTEFVLDPTGYVAISVYSAELSDSSYRTTSLYVSGQFSRRGLVPLTLVNRKCRAGEDWAQGGAG
ncbi:hypothetical protein GCM10010399_17660 [Dactylosporangium fulvum]